MAVILPPKHGEAGAGDHRLHGEEVHPRPDQIFQHNHSWCADNISRVNLTLNGKVLKDMKATGIVRRIDDLGRVVIPKEIRRTMRIREGDPLLTTLTGKERAIWYINRLGKRLKEGENCAHRGDLVT